MEKITEFIEIFQYLKYGADSSSEIRKIKEFEDIISNSSYRLKESYLYKLNKIKSDFKNLPLFYDQVDQEKFRATRDNLVQLVRQILLEEGSKIFVVHGRDVNMRLKVLNLLQDIKIEHVILENETNEGKTILEKFIAKSSDCNYAIILMSADDEGGIAPATNNLQKRARQNVVLELGFFLGKLDRHRILILFDEGIEKPSDFDGFVHILYDREGDWKLKVLKELKAANFVIPLAT